MVGSSPSGTLATSMPMAKLIAAATDSPASNPRGRKARAPAMATRAMSLATVFTWTSSGLVSRPDPLGQRGDAADLGTHARGTDQRSGLAGQACAATENHVLCLKAGDGSVTVTR